MRNYKLLPEYTQEVDSTIYSSNVTSGYVSMEDNNLHVVKNYQGLAYEYLLLHR